MKLKNILTLSTSVLFISTSVFILSLALPTSWEPIVFIYALFALIILLLSDKIYLAFFQAKKASGSSLLLNSIKNNCFRLNISNIDIYISKKFPANTIVLESVTGRSSLVIGNSLFNYLSKREREVLILISLSALKNGEGYKRNHIGFCMLPCVVFFKCIESLKDVVFIKYLVVVAQFFLYPNIILQKWLIPPISHSKSFYKVVDLGLVHEYELNALLKKIYKFEIQLDQLPLRNTLERFGLFHRERDPFLASPNLLRRKNFPN